MFGITTCPASKGGDTNPVVDKLAKSWRQAFGIVGRCCNLLQPRLNWACEARLNENGGVNFWEEESRPFVLVVFSFANECECLWWSNKCVWMVQVQAWQFCDLTDPSHLKKPCEVKKIVSSNRAFAALKRSCLIFASFHLARTLIEPYCLCSECSYIRLAVRALLEVMAAWSAGVVITMVCGTQMDSVPCRFGMIWCISSSTDGWIALNCSAEGQMPEFGCKKISAGLSY